MPSETGNADIYEMTTRRNENYNKLNSEINNPCLKEHSLVNRCLDDNGYDYQKCNLQVANYKVCKQFWGHVQRERRLKGIEPNLPDPKDREQAKKEYAHLL